MTTLFLIFTTTMITMTAIIVFEYVLGDDLNPITVTLLIGSIFKFWTSTWRSESTSRTLNACSKQEES
ncbi:unnamed protein product [Caenorhabditis nigoni]